MSDSQSEKKAAYLKFLIQGIIFLILSFFANQDPTAFFTLGGIFFFISIPVYLYTAQLTFKGWEHYRNSGEFDINLTILVILSFCAIISFTIFIGYAPSWVRQLTNITVFVSGVASLLFSLIWFASKRFK